MSTALIELHFLPSLEYLSAVRNFSDLVLERHENYQKQTYRNRCQVLTSQGVETLVVPLTNKHGKTKITDVKIDYSQRWQNVHWRTLESAYRKAPFFEHYEEGLREIIYANELFLYDLNMRLLSFCLQNIRWTIHISESVTYEKQPSTGVADLRNMINAKKPYDARPFYQPHSYYQVFGNRFVPNLAFIDVLFNAGPQALRVIDQSSKEYLNK